MIDLTMKNWIDNATYEELLYKWRFEPSDSPWFQDEIGEYYSAVMSKKRNEDNDRHVAASKSIGWEK